MQKFYASDLDGTIVSEKDFLISKETIFSINKFQEFSGNSFFLVTGRSYAMVKKYIKDLNIQLPCICSNGAVIIDPIKNLVLYKKTMEQSVVLKIIDYSLKNDLNISFHTPNGLVAIEGDERICKYYEIMDKWESKENLDVQIYQNLEKIKEGFLNNEFEVVKILVSFPNDVEESIANSLHEFADKNDLYHPFVYIQNRLLIDLMNKGIDKSIGLIEWAKLKNVNPKEIVTFGDNLNDLEMTKYVNFGVAVGNAIDELKKVASLTVDTIENNGVGKFLEEVIKNG